jgi:chromosome segregation ATPase
MTTYVHGATIPPQLRELRQQIADAMEIRERETETVRELQHQRMAIRGQLADMARQLTEAEAQLANARESAAEAKAAANDARAYAKRIDEQYELRAAIVSNAKEEAADIRAAADEYAKTTRGKAKQYAANLRTNHRRGKRTDGLLKDLVKERYGT